MADEAEVSVVQREGTVCGICHDSCPEREVLPCSHCYCRQCIHQVALGAGVIKPFPCPECATDTILPTAFFVKAMKERGFRSKRANGTTASQNCTKHRKPLEWYCFDCDSLICSACTIKDHLGHSFEFTDLAAKQTKTKLVQQLDSLVGIKKVLLHALEDVQTTKLEVEDQGQSMADQIESSFEELLKIIENHKQELLKQALLKVRQKSKHLSEQEKGLSTSYASVQSTIDLTKQCVKYSTDDQVLRMHTEIQSRIRQIEEQQKERKDLEPVEEVDLGVEVNCAEDLEQLCQAKAKLTQLVIDCTATGEGLKSAEVNKTSQFEVSTHLSNGRPTKRSCEVKCTLKSLANDSTTECQVELIEGNKFRIQYTPTVRGRHELIVTMNGQEVGGSPFPVFVSIHPTLLGKPIQVISGMKEPCDVAVTATGNIIVTESKNVALFDKDGKKLKRFDISKFGIADPSGVAVDSTDGCIYISVNTTIIKLSPDFKRLGGFTGSEWSRHRYVAVVGDEVMASEGSNNVVMVYTKDLKYVRQIGSSPGQLKDIGGVSSDRDSNLYICDTRGCVHVFHNGGEFLHLVGEGKLNHPQGVCTIGQYVYVANYLGGCVSVFTTEGVYVTSFGQKDGNLRYPRGVCVDKDGFVYVCDYYNGRVKIF